MAKILVVEDSATVRETLASFLEENGYGVSLAVDGSEAIVKAADEVPDLILLDLMLPDMNGNEVALLLRQNEKTKSIPLVIVTAKTERRDEVRGLELGALYYIKKPYDPNDLLDKVKIALSVAKK